MPIACNLPYCDEDKEMLDRAARGEANVIDPRVLALLPQANESILKRIEELGREEINDRIEKGPERVEGKLTPELVEKFLRDEYHSWPKRIVDRIYNYGYTDKPKLEEGGRVLGETTFLSFSDKTRIDIYKSNSRNPIKVKETITHEVAHIDFDDLPKEDKEKWKELFDKDTNYQKEREVIGEYSIGDYEENYCQWLAMFKWQPERLRDLSPTKFNFIKERYISIEVEKMKEQFLGEV